MTDQATFNPAQLELLRCPEAVQRKDLGDDPGKLTQINAHWLYAADSGNKYPIHNGIPYLLVKEGQRWRETPDANLPTPPPAPLE